MEIERQLLIAAIDYASRIAAAWGIAIFALDGFARIRSQGVFHFLRGLDAPGRIMNDILHVRPIYPGDSYPNYIPDDEESFYKEFGRRLGKAQSQIFLSGDGFNMAKRRATTKAELESADKADILDAAIYSALVERKGDLVYKRFQITSACPINWLSRIIFMKETFGDQYRVFVDPNYDHIGCFCAIDPAHYRCVFEWQILSGRHYLDGNRIKGYGFLYTNRSICEKLRGIFKEIEDKNNDMSADDLRDLQRTLWVDRAKKMGADPKNYKPIDPEMRARFKQNPNDMDFRPDDFPPLPCPTIDTSSSLKRLQTRLASLF
jgi:hypothetical protein